MRLAGIDPGIHGGIAIIDSCGQVEEVNLLQNVVPKTWLLERKIKLVYIEQCQSFPGQGIASAFNYGREYGYLLGTLAGSGVLTRLVRPGEWTKKIHKIYVSQGEAKDKSLLVAKHIWPETSFLATARSKKPHDGLIDAALIAYFGWLSELQTSQE